nr:MAG: replication initiation protein [Microvirus sp.]
MPCYHPLHGHHHVNFETDKKFFSKNMSDSSEQVTFGCGQCIGCKLERSRQWAIRCHHEVQYQESIGKPSCFLTLTLNDFHIPRHQSLDKTQMQKFWKSLRFQLPDTDFSYYMCGEYGDETQRPHYHAILFGHDFEDKELLHQNHRGENLYKSPQLEKIWGKGHCSIGAATFDSAAYVARYITKKITGKHSAGHYGDRIPEYTNMSLKTPIGKKWFEKYHKDVYPSDQVIIGTKELLPPRYYDKLLENLDIDMFNTIKDKRKAAAKANLDCHPQRLLVKEYIKTKKAKQLLRDKN